MRRFISPFFGRWVRLVEKNPLSTLFILFVLTIMSAFYSLTHFSINSDLDSLIEPTREHQWYVDDRIYKAAFPQYQQVAAVVISSQSAEQSYITAEALYHAFNDSGYFSEVFAPAFDEFFVDHALYAASTEGVKMIAANVESNLPGIGKIYNEPTIDNFLQHLESAYQQANYLEVFVPETKHQLEVFTSIVEQLDEGEPPNVQLMKSLAPEDSEGKSYQIIALKAPLRFSEKLPNAAMMKDIRHVIRQVEKPDNVKIRITGEIALAHEEISSGLSGVQLAGILSLFLLAIVLGLGVRSKSIISSIFVMLSIGVIWTSAFALLTVGAFNTLSLVFLVMFFGLGVDFAVHYSLRIVEAKTFPKTRLSPAVEAIVDIGPALTLCAVTSATAFLSFLPTAYSGLADLGIISAGGMFIALLLSITFFPAWFSVFGVGSGEDDETGRAVFFDKLRISWPQLPARPVLVITGLAVILAVWYAKDVSFNYSHLSMRDKSSEAMSTLLEMQKERLGTEYSISVIVDPEEDIESLKQALLDLDSVAEVSLPQDYLPLFQEFKYQYMQPVAEKLKQFPPNSGEAEVDYDATKARITGFIDEIESSDDVFVGEDKETIDDFRESLKKLLKNRDHWPALQDAIADGVQSDMDKLLRWFSAKPFTIESMPSDVKSRFVADDGRYLINVLPSLDMSDKSKMETFIKDVYSVAPNAAGRTIVEWGVGNVVVTAFTQAAILALCLIMLFLIINFRRLSTAILVFIPLLISSIFTIAIARFFGLSFNMANILVIPLIFGLGVDTGIHVVHRYKHSNGINELMGSATIKAVLISALTTIGTFLSLSLSPHKGAASVGLLLGLAITLLLVVTFIVLPALLETFEPNDEDIDIAKELEESFSDKESSS